MTNAVDGWVILARWKLGLVGVSLLFALAACAAGPAAPVAGSGERALLDDADFDRATLVTAGRFRELVGEELPELVGLRVDADALDVEPAREVSPHAVLPDAAGIVAFVRHNPNLSSNPWMVYLMDQATDTTTLVYGGRREIDSVAVSADGSTLLLAMHRAHGGNADFEVYRVNVGSGSVERLTETGYDESNVSMSADGSVLVWEGRVPGNRRAVFVREGDVEAVLGLALEQREPSVSSNGRYIGLVRVLASGNLRVVRYDRVSNTYLVAWGQPLPVTLSHPSTSADGQRIAFLEHRPAGAAPTERQLVRLLDVSAGSVANAVAAQLTDGPRIAHPHLTHDGDHLAYGWRQGQAWNVFTRRISTGEVQRIAVSAAPTVNLAPYWQQPPASAVLAVAIEPADPEVRVGETIALTAIVTVAGEASQAVVWSTLDDALVDVADTGVVSGLQTGVATVTATSVADPTKSASVAVAVRSASGIVSVAIEPEAPVVEAGGSLALTGIVTMDGPVSAELVWVSDDESVAVVTATGLLLGLMTGVTQVTATSVADPAQSATVEVTVVEPADGVAVVIVPAFLAMPLGWVETLTAHVYGADLTEVTWSTTCGTVDPVPGSNQAQYASPPTMGLGFCYVFAASVTDPSAVGVAEVTLTDEGPVLAVTVFPREPVVEEGASLQLQAEVVINDDVAEAVLWETGDSSIATVDPFNGLLTGVTAGTTTVTATSVADPSKSDTVDVTVMEPAPAVRAVRLTDWAGNELTEVWASNDCTMEPGIVYVHVDAVGGASDAVVWSVADPELAFVEVFEGVGLIYNLLTVPGNTTVTVTSVFDPTVSASVTAHLWAAPCPA